MILSQIERFRHVVNSYLTLHAGWCSVWRAYHCLIHVLCVRIKNLQADLTEKDSLIHVLQRHPSLSRTNSISSLLASAASCASPQNSPQQQHRMLPAGATLHGPVGILCNSGGGCLSSKPSSGSSSRQSSQLSGASASVLSSSLPKHSKIGRRLLCLVVGR